MNRKFYSEKNEKYFNISSEFEAVAFQMFEQMTPVASYEKVSNGILVKNNDGSVELISESQIENYV